MLPVAMYAHCDTMKPHSHRAFSPKGRCAYTGRHEQNVAFLLSGAGCAVGDSTAGRSGNPLLWERPERAEGVAKIAPRVERLSGKRGSEGNGFEGTQQRDGWVRSPKGKVMITP